MLPLLAAGAAAAGAGAGAAEAPKSPSRLEVPPPPPPPAFLRARDTRAGRLETALALCADPALDCLITEEVAFADLPARHEAIMATDAPGIATIIRYE